VVVVVVAIDALLLEDLTTLFIDFDCQSDRLHVAANEGSDCIGR